VQLDRRIVFVASESAPPIAVELTAYRPGLVIQSADLPEGRSFEALQRICIRTSRGTILASRTSSARARPSARAACNPTLVDKPQTLEDLKFNNYFKEMDLDSDTKVAWIIDVARPLGIAVHDHIIDGKDGHASLKGLKLM
jgi:hypothetical protein